MEVRCCNCHLWSLPKQFHKRYDTPETNKRENCDNRYILCRYETDHEERPLLVKFKKSVINMLSSSLQKINCQTCHSQADAGLLIYQTAVESARRVDNVLVGDDTNLLVLLCHYTQLDAHESLFKPEPRAILNWSHVWSMKVVKEKLGEDVCNIILFIYAILGCDTKGGQWLGYLPWDVKIPNLRPTLNTHQIWSL